MVYVMLEPVPVFAVINPLVGAATTVRPGVVFDAVPVVDTPSRKFDCPMDVTVTPLVGTVDGVPLYDTVNVAVLAVLLLALQFSRTGLPAVAPTVDTVNRPLVACRRPMENVNASTAKNIPKRGNLNFERSI
jgi:hypothetical protein